MNTYISILTRMQGKKDIHQIPPDSSIRLGSFFARPCLHFMKKKYVLMLVSKSERAREREREKDQLLTMNNLLTDRREMQKKREQTPCVDLAS